MNFCKLMYNIKSTVMVIVFCDFLKFYKIFFSPLEKRNVIINNKHGIYKLSFELTNNVRFRILGKKEIPRKYQNFIEL